MIYYFVASLLLALIFAVLMTTQWALLLSPVIGALAFFFWRLIDPEEMGGRGHLRAVLTAAIGCALGFGAGLLMGFTDAPLFDAAGILLAAIVASALYSWRAQSRTVSVCALPESSIRPRRVRLPAMRRSRLHARQLLELASRAMHAVLRTGDRDPADSREVVGRAARHAGDDRRMPELR